MNYQKYTIRTCRWLNGCKLCGTNIVAGEKYYDGGSERRAHLVCNDLTGGLEFVKWMKNRGEAYENLRIKLYEDGEPYFSSQGAEMSLSEFLRADGKIKKLKKMNDFLNKIICGSALEVLKTMPDESINSVITSPPYFNLRDYGVEGQIGLESTWQEYIGKLIDIFNEIKRVLKKDGTCFVNLGDSYGTQSGASMGRVYNSEKTYLTNRGNGDTLLKPKDKDWHKSLMMIPERFGIAMIDQGWILRNKLVWIKRNVMPESVQDRWKKAHEYIFFFVKNKNYYFDLDAIRTRHKEISIKRAEYEQGRNAMGLNPSSVGNKYSKDKSDKYGMPARQVKLNPLGAVPPDFFDINTNCKGDETVEHYATYPLDLIYPLVKSGSRVGDIILDPFMGSGSSAVAAKRLNRRYVGIELNPSYIKIANDRLRQEILL